VPYTPLSDKDRLRILGSIGVEVFEDLLAELPARLRLKTPLDLPEGMSEQDLAGLMGLLSRENSTVDDYKSFLGAGAYNHYIPATVDSLISRSEFFTAYTPYQPEISQGTLQAIFEYQTLICQLTGMDVSNASLYDGASAVSEAVLMARRITKRDGVLLSTALHPEYRETVKTYLRGSGGPVKEVLYCTEAGTTLPEAVSGSLTEDTACLVVQNPNFFGSIEDMEELAGVVKKSGALLIVAVTEPVSLGLLRPPGDSGADIVVGEGQSFGNPLNFGGPYLGFLSTRDKYIRQMPGRVVGQSVDSDGKRAFCLTFATREQHIRREKATSNICTNEGLCALSTAVHLISLGLTGLKKLSSINLSKSEYLKEKLFSIEGIEAAFSASTFNEFTVRVKGDPEDILKKLLEKGFIGGLALKRFYPEMKDHILIAATEKNARVDLIGLAGEFSKAINT